MKYWIKNAEKWFRNLKYRKKLYLVFMLVSLFLLIVMGVFMIHGFKEILTEKEYQSMEVSLNQACETIDKQIDIYKNLLNYMVFDQDLQDVLEAEQTQNYDSYNNYVNIIDPILDAPKFYHDGINSLTIYSDNIKIPHDVTLAPLSEINEKSWFPELQNTAEVLWIWPDSQRDEILAIRRFPGYRKAEVYLGMYFDLESLMEPLDYFQKEGSGILLVDDNEQIVYSQCELKNSKKVERLEQLENHYSYLKRQIDGLPICTYIYMEKSSVYAGFYEMLGTIGIVMLFSLGTILIIGGYMSKLLVVRIERLTACVNEVKLGKMEICIEDDSSDEIGTLIRSFHQMLDQINRLIQKVYESKITQQNLEMQALQAQINPHFLYNTLSIINWKAICAGEDDISTVTLALSDYYRTTLNKGENFITVSGELLNIKSYLEIQLMMHDYEFEVEYQIDSEVKAYYMPKLILQPLIENALEHGLDVKTEGNKKLLISCQQHEENIVLTVQDNGVGMEENLVEDLVKTHASGYGVKNVNDRLALLYGKNYALHIESHVGEGTKIEIYIPKENSAQRKDAIDEIK